MLRDTISIMNRDDQINTIITKGVEQILPSSEFLKTKLLKNERLTLYCGFDPTAPTLHIGHAIQLRKLRQFQELGHEIIFLIGDFTARIGDPTDKLATRVQLSEREVKKNLRLYKQQASAFIRFSGKNAAKIKYNNRWLRKLRLEDIITLGTYVTVDQMLKRDMFVKRATEEKPIYLHEFFYPLMQGYDSVAMGVDGEVGGNDQLFNMMMGRQLLKQIKGKEKFVVTTKLLEDATGKKMGKTEGNMVALTDTAEDMFGKVMSWPDGFIERGLELCTDMKNNEIVDFFKEVTHPKDQKIKLAFEIVKSVHGEVLAEKAKQHFENVFKEKHIPEMVPALTHAPTLKESLMLSGAVSSMSALRRLVEDGAVTSAITGKTFELKDLNSPPQKDVIKIGKKDFWKIL